MRRKDATPEAVTLISVSVGASVRQVAARRQQQQATIASSSSSLFLGHNKVASSCQLADRRREERRSECRSSSQISPRKGVDGVRAPSWLAGVGVVRLPSPLIGRRILFECQSMDDEDKFTYLSSRISCAFMRDKRRLTAAGQTIDLGRAATPRALTTFDCSRLVFSLTLDMLFTLFFI